MPKKRFIIANWKTNLNLEDIVKWLDTFKKTLPVIPENKIVILAPSDPYLGLMHEITKNSLNLAAQNISLVDRGAHTGQTGVFQIKDFCSYSIIGHSELKETYEISIQKRDKCIENGITPIFCFDNIDKLPSAYAKNSLTVWEDPQNISKEGVSRAEPLTTIKAKIDTIRDQLPAEAVLIYGGSVNRQNVENLSTINGLDGILIGNASNDPVHFAELVTKF